MRKLPNIFTALLPAGVICLLLVVLFSGGDGLCQDVPGREGQGPEGVESNQQVADEPFAYQTEGRPDPFRPFITATATAPAGKNPDEIVDEETELTGMQLFEPGQLTLVGVLTSESGPVAMVEDQTKKGYLFNLGTPIGKRGVVAQIDQQQVVVMETARTRAGKEITSTVIMRMNKEGDK